MYHQQMAPKCSYSVLKIQIKHSRLLYCYLVQENIQKETILNTPLESDIRWPRQNTLEIPLVSDHNLLVEGRFIKKKVPNIRPFEKY